MKDIATVKYTPGEDHFLRELGRVAKLLFESYTKRQDTGNPCKNNVKKGDLEKLSCKAIENFQKFAILSFNNGTVARSSTTEIALDDDIGNEVGNAMAGFTMVSLGTMLTGAHLGGAAVNNQWNRRLWNYDNPETWAGAVTGGLGGLLLPFAYFYSFDLMGVPGTLAMTIVGGYLGGASANENWEIERWNLISPVTYNGIFEGVANGVWLVEAIVTLHRMANDLKLHGPLRSVYFLVTYGSGLAISYHYIAQFHNGNYNFAEWNRVDEPGTLFAILLGLESATRYPIAAAEILMGFVKALQEVRDTITQSGDIVAVDQSVLSTVQEIKYRNRWRFLGAGFIGWIFAGRENNNLDWTQWDYTKFSTYEQLYNGIVYGKDIEELLKDLRNGLARKILRRKGKGAPTQETVKVKGIQKRDLTLRLNQIPQFEPTQFKLQMLKYETRIENSTELNNFDYINIPRHIYRVHNEVTNFPPVSSGASSTKRNLLFPPILFTHTITSFIQKASKTFQNIYSGVTSRLYWNTHTTESVPQEEHPGYSELFTYSANKESESVLEGIWGQDAMSMSESTCASLGVSAGVHKQLIVCDGEETYHHDHNGHNNDNNIPGWSNHGKIFDNVDGQLMLARVACNLISRAWHATVQSAKTKDKEKGKMQKTLVKIDQRDIRRWEKRLSEVDTLLRRKMMKANRKCAEDLRWASVELSECREELKRFAACHELIVQDDFEVFVEKATALKEDLGEEMVPQKWGNIGHHQHQLNQWWLNIQEPNSCSNPQFLTNYDQFVLLSDVCNLE